MGNTTKLIIIKLGGSVVTFKDSASPKIRLSTIKKLSKEIFSIQKMGYKLVIVHGAGSYGHPLAKKYKLTQGFINKNSCEGFYKTILSMKRLNNLIIEKLHQAKIQAVGLSPHGFIFQKNGRLLNFDISVIKNLLDYKLVPVLYGDAVLDTKIGCSILSGDVIIPYLAKKLKADKVIFLSDVDGIFDDDPKKNPQAKLIKKINNKNLKQVLSGIKSTGRDDVTGEMTGKILSISKNLKGIPIIIANGLKPGTALKALGQSPIGTKLHFD